MTKAAAYAVRTRSRRLISAFVVGTFAAVVVCSAYAASRIPALSEVPLYLFWISLSLAAFKFRFALRRLPVGLILFVIGFEVLVVSNSCGFDSCKERRVQQYAALTAAVRSNDTASVERVLKGDDDPDYVPPRPAFCNSDMACYYDEKPRPVDIAVDHGNLKIAQTLVAHGATVCTSGSSLEAAAARGDVPMLLFLLDHGADANGLDGSSDALVGAVIANQPAAVASLLNAGANPNSAARPAYGADSATCLSLAQRMNAREIVLLLRRAGATE